MTTESNAQQLFPEMGPIDHLEPRTRRLLDKPDDVRIRAILRDRLVRYPALEAVADDAAWMAVEPRSVRARGLIVCGERNNGKTAMARYIQRRFGDYETQGKPTVVQISMSGVRDSRTFYGLIMEELGSPARISHRIADRQNLVVRLLRSVNCHLLILDEVQDITLGSEREQIHALEGLKQLMNKLQVNILAFGNDRAGEAFSADRDMAERFEQLQLPVWQADATLVNFLATYERLLPLKRASSLASPETVTYLAKECGGLLGHIVKRVQNAAISAIMDGSEAITKSHLAAGKMRPLGCPLVPTHRRVA